MNRPLTTTSTVLALALGGLCSSSTAQSDCASPGADMVAWWDGDGPAPDQARDLIGTAPATPVSGSVVGRATGHVGQALSFGQGQPYLLTGRRLLDTTGPFSVEAWVRPGAFGAGDLRTIVAEVGVGASRGQFALRLDATGRAHLFRKNGSVNNVDIALTQSTLPSFVWTHVTAVYRGGTSLEVYFNGVRQAVTRGTSQWVSTGASVTTTIGGIVQSRSYLFDGQIDELTMYRRALSNAEITAISNASIRGKCKSCAAPPAQPSFWWSADQVCGGFAMDGAGGHAAETRNVSARSGIVGDAFEFSGSASSYVSTGVPVVATPGPFTVMAWVNTDNSGRLGGIVSETGTTGGSVVGHFSIRQLTGGAVQFYRKPNDNVNVDLVTSAAPLVAGQWKHVACVYGGPGDMRVYVDGDLSSGAIAQNLYRPAVPVQTTIGAGEAGVHTFDGRIDEVLIYHQALTENQVDSVYRAGRFGVCSSPAQEFACIPGSGMDFRLQSMVGATGLLDAPQKLAFDGDLLTVLMDSPNGGHVGDIPILVAQAYPNGAMPGPSPVFPDLHIDLSQAWFATPNLGGLGSVRLPPQGLAMAFSVPGGLQGFTVRFQSAIFAPATFGFSGAHDVQMR